MWCGECTRVLKPLVSTQRWLLGTGEGLHPPSPNEKPLHVPGLAAALLFPSAADAGLALGKGLSPRQSLAAPLETGSADGAAKELQCVQAGITLEPLGSVRRRPSLEAGFICGIELRSGNAAVTRLGAELCAAQRCYRPGRERGRPRCPEQ